MIFQLLIVLLGLISGPLAGAEKNKRIRPKNEFRLVISLRGASPEQCEKTQASTKKLAEEYCQREYKKCSQAYMEILPPEEKGVTCLYAATSIGERSSRYKRNQIKRPDSLSQVIIPPQEPVNMDPSER